MTSELLGGKHIWVRRIGWAVFWWAFMCGVLQREGLSPRPLLLAGLIAALWCAAWLVIDGIRLSEPANWHNTDARIARPPGVDTRIVTLAARISEIPVSIPSRVYLHQLLMDLADERLLSLHGIDRQLDPAGALAALGPELSDYIAIADPGAALSEERMSLLLTRIESL